MQLTDSFGRRHNYLRISVTDRCNFRCVYCMPAEGVVWRERAEILTFEEIVRLAKVFVRLGVDKIRLTGGEPTVRKGLESLIRELAGIEGVRSLRMTTNGHTLAAMAHAYKEAGLTGINVSLDTLRRERFVEIARTDRLEVVQQGIEAALLEGFEPMKLNTVVMAGVNDDELLDFVELARDRPMSVRFIEFMPFRQNGWTRGELLPYAEMRRRISERFELAPIADEKSAVGKEFAIEGFRGRVGFVTSMTENFCDGCSRVRLTADGQIKTCLFSPAESSLRDVIRGGGSDEEVEAVIRGALWLKQKEHAPMEELLQIQPRSMVEIGG